MLVLEVLESHLLLMLVLEEVPMLEALASCADGYRTPMATWPLPASCASILEVRPSSYLLAASWPSWGPRDPTAPGAQL